MIFECYRQGADRSQENGRIAYTLRDLTVIWDPELDELVTYFFK